MNGCECCGGPLGCLDHTLCQRCLIWVPDAAIALGHAIARFVRRAEVARLVEEVCGDFNEAVGAAEAGRTNSVDRHYLAFRDALDRLAQLAGGGS